MIKKLLFVTFILLSVSVLAQAPVLTNFRIENANKNRVYFDSSDLITATTVKGFKIEGKNIYNITINSGGTTGHYFKVSTPFTYWDNNLIRYEGVADGKESDLADFNNNRLFDFTLQYIENNIAEPTAITDRYVSVSGGGDGTSIGSPWTLSQAVSSATAGMTVHIAKGTYPNLTYTIKNSGKATNPIKFIGYGTNPGDKPVLTRSTGMSFDTDVMPLIDGKGNSGICISVTKNSYLIFKNIQIQGYTGTSVGKGGINANNSTHLVFDNMYLKEGFWGINFNNPKGGYNKVLNSYVADISGVGINMYNAYNLVDNTWAVSSKVVSMDYYIATQGGKIGHSNTVRNCRVDRFPTDSHSGHGITIRSDKASEPIEHSLVENNTIINSRLEPRHRGAQRNIFRGNNLRGSALKVMLHDGPSYNIFENNTFSGDGTSSGVRWYESSEDSGQQANAHHNKFINCIWDDMYILLQTGTFDTGQDVLINDNEFINCTFNNISKLIISKANNFDSTNKFTNCIFSGVISHGGGTESITFNYNDFWNSWTKSRGSNSFNVNPTFDANFVPSNKDLNAGLPLKGAEYDKNKNQRSSTPTMGAIEILDASTGSVNANAGPDVQICNGESATLRATGGISYVWNTGATTASINVSPTEETTTFTVTVSDGINSDTDDVIVTVNEPPSVNVGKDVTLCFGESITLTAEGEGDFLWSNGETTASITVSPTVTTTYSVTASNSCSIEATDDVIVTVTPGINLTTIDDLEVCTGEIDTILTADSNGDYLWSTGETSPTITVNPTSTTTYTITSTLGDCSITDEVVVTVNEAPTVNAGSDVSLCSGEAVTLTANGIGDFLWSTGETTSSITVNPASTTTYSVTASNSCSIEATDDVIVTVTPGINLTTIDDLEVCTGEIDTILTADSNGDYLWSTGETSPTITVNPTSTTTYTITSTLGDCSITDEVVVTVNEAPTVNAGSDVSLCSGEAVTLTANGIGDFLWSTGETTSSITVNPASTTTYSVTASNSCSDPVSDEVMVNITPAITLDAGIDVTLCSGESTTLTVTSNGNILWSTGETSASIVVNPSTTTTYAVTSSSGECSLTDEVIVTINNFSSVSLGDDTKICLGESITLTAEGIGNFLWSTGETSSSIVVNPTVSTTYTVTASTSCSDPVTDEIIVIVNDLPVIDAGSDVTIENGSSTVLTAIGEGEFLWSTGETSSSITVSPTSTTTYSVTLTSLEGCSNQDNVIVNVSDNSTTTSAINIDAVPDQNICLDESVTLIATGGSNYLWSTGETTTSITVSPTETTIYAVTISNGNTVQVDDITIFVDETCSGISNRLNEKESKLYPNPTEGVLNIELANFSNESVISIFDINGRLVYSDIVDNYSPVKIFKRQINLSNFGKGIYFVRFFNNNISETKKVLVI